MKVKELYAFTEPGKGVSVWDPVSGYDFACAAQHYTAIGQLLSRKDRRVLHSLTFYMEEPAPFSYSVKARLFKCMPVVRIDVSLDCLVLECKGPPSARRWKEVLSVGILPTMPFCKTGLQVVGLKWRKLQATQVPCDNFLRPEIERRVADIAKAKYEGKGFWVVATPLPLAMAEQHPQTGEGNIG